METQTILDIHIKAILYMMEKRGVNNRELSRKTGLSPSMIGRYFADDISKRSAMPLEGYLKICNALGYEDMVNEVARLVESHSVEVTFQIVHRLTVGTTIPVRYGVFLVKDKVVASGKISNKATVYITGDIKAVPIDKYKDAMGIRKMPIEVIRDAEQIELTRFFYTKWQQEQEDSTNESKST